MGFGPIIGATTHPPATESDLDAIQGDLPGALAIAYRALLKHSNGVLFGNGVHLYGTLDLVERNTTWEVAEYSPGYVAVGDNSGGMVYLMRNERNDTAVFESDSGDMDPANFRTVSPSLESWVQSGCPVR